jgi:hypothetical protein
MPGHPTISEVRELSDAGQAGERNHWSETDGRIETAKGLRALHHAAVGEAGMHAGHERRPRDANRLRFEGGCGDVGESNPLLAIEPAQTAHLAPAEWTSTVEEDLEASISWIPSFDIRVAVLAHGSVCWMTIARPRLPWFAGISPSGPAEWIKRKGVAHGFLLI